AGAMVKPPRIVHNGIETDSGDDGSRVLGCADFATHIGHPAWSIGFLGSCFRYKNWLSISIPDVAKQIPQGAIAILSHANLGTCARAPLIVWIIIYSD